MPLYGAFPLRGMVQYGSFLEGFPLGTVPRIKRNGFEWTHFSINQTMGVLLFVEEVQTFLLLIAKEWIQRVASDPSLAVLI